MTKSSHASFVIRHSDLFRHSGFVIRHFVSPGHGCAFALRHVHVRSSAALPASLEARLGAVARVASWCRRCRRRGTARVSVRRGGAASPGWRVRVELPGCESRLAEWWRPLPGTLRSDRCGRLVGARAHFRCAPGVPCRVRRGARFGPNCVGSRRFRPRRIWPRYFWPCLFGSAMPRAESHLAELRQGA